MENKIFKSLVFRIISWIIIWAAIWIICIDYLPSHAHFEYMGIVSPLILIILPFYDSAVTDNAYSLVIIPGIFFWIVIGILIYINMKKNATKSL